MTKPEQIKNLISRGMVEEAIELLPENRKWFHAKESLKAALKNSREDDLAVIRAGVIALIMNECRQREKKSLW